MDQIVDDFERVLAALRSTAPGLFGIHGEFDKILTNLRDHSAIAPAPMVITAEQLRAVPQLRPEVLAGMTGNAPVIVPAADEDEDAQEES